MQTAPMSEYGYTLIENELKDLKQVQQPEVLKEIDIARSHGDLKENAEYHAAKEKQAFIEKKIAELGSLLSIAKIVDPSSYEHDEVRFGSFVSVMNLDDESVQNYTLVGLSEVNLDKGYISISSPLASAMLGKKIGDEFKVNLPKGECEFEIIDLKYIPLSFN